MSGRVGRKGNSPQVHREILRSHPYDPPRSGFVLGIHCSETTTPSPSKRILNPVSSAASIITLSTDLSSITVGIRLPVQATRELDEIDSGYSRVTRMVSGSIEGEMASEPLPLIFPVSSLGWDASP